MGRKTLATIISVILIILIILFFTKKVSAREEDYFNNIELSNNNFITNSNGIAFLYNIASIVLFGLYIVILLLKDVFLFIKFQSFSNLK